MDWINMDFGAPMPAIVGGLLLVEFWMDQL